MDIDIYKKTPAVRERSKLEARRVYFVYYDTHFWQRRNIMKRYEITWEDGLVEWWYGVSPRHAYERALYDRIDRDDTLSTHYIEGRYEPRFPLKWRAEVVALDSKFTVFSSYDK